MNKPGLSCRLLKFDLSPSVVVKVQSAPTDLEPPVLPEPFNGQRAGLPAGRFELAFERKRKGFLPSGDLGGEECPGCQQPSQQRQAIHGDPLGPPPT